MSAPPVARLLAVLEAEERVYLELRDLLQRERELMLALDAPALVEAAREKEVLANEARLLEESRIALAGELAAGLGLVELRPTLSRLCQALGDAAGGLRDAHTRLVVLASVVRELLDANAALAGDHLSRIQRTLSLLGRLLPGEAVYLPGQPAPAPGVGRLLSRTA